MSGTTGSAPVNGNHGKRPDTRLALERLARHRREDRDQQLADDAERLRTVADEKRAEAERRHQQEVEELRRVDAEIPDIGRPDWLSPDEPVSPPPIVPTVADDDGPLRAAVPLLTPADLTAAAAAFAGHPALAKIVLGVFDDSRPTEVFDTLFSDSPLAHETFFAAAGHYKHSSRPPTAEWLAKLVESDARPERALAVHAEIGSDDLAAAIAHAIESAPAVPAARQLWRRVWDAAVGRWLDEEQEYAANVGRETDDVRARAAELLAAGERFSESGNVSLEEEGLDLFLTDDRTDGAEYLVEKLIAPATVGTIGGGDKKCKSAIACDLAISLVAAIPFLGRWPVPRSVRVGLVNCESGRGVLQETLRRVAKAKGIDLAELIRAGRLYVSTRRPDLLSAAWIDELERLIVERQLECLLMDPMYLMMADADQTSLTRMAVPLGRLRDLAERTGCAIVVVHHVKRPSESQPYRKPRRRDLVGAGPAEWSRFWILVGSRREWDPVSGTHWLHLVVGSSAGGEEYLPLTIREGRVDDPGRRKWAVEFDGTMPAERPLPPPAATAPAAPVPAAAPKEGRRKTDYHALVRVTVSAMQLPASRNAVATAVGGRRDTVLAAIRAMVDAGELVESDDLITGLGQHHREGQHP